MVAVRLSVTIGEDRRLVIDLPDTMPVGPAELIIRPEDSGQGSARELLSAAGVLVTDLGIPDDLDEVADEELEELGRLAPGARPSEELINEDRGAY